MISFEFPPNSLVMGGAGTYAEFLADGLIRKGIDLHVITTGPKTESIGNVHRLFVSNYSYWRSFLFVQSAASLLSQLNSLHKFDLVHFNEPHFIFDTSGLPTACTFHSTQLHELELRLRNSSQKDVKSIIDLFVKNPFGYATDILTALRSDAIICPSEDLKQLLRYCFVREKKISVVYNGIEPDMFKAVDDDDALLVKYSLKKGGYVLYMGRLYATKGIQFLIKAFRSLKGRHGDLKLVIAGTGDFEGYLRQIAAGSEDVIFVGHVSSLAVKKSLFENCLAVAVPSIYETFPMVALEAMCCSKPIIASDVGGLKILVRQNKNGLLMKPEDELSIAESILLLKNDAERARKMGLYGRKLVETDFTVENMVNRTVQLYDAMLK